MFIADRWRIPLFNLPYSGEATRIAKVHVRTKKNDTTMTKIIVRNF